MLRWTIPLFFLIFFEIVADFFAKKYSLEGKWFFWVIAILGYVVANIFWLNSLRNGSGLARGSIIFSVGTAIVSVTLAVFVFKEKISEGQFFGLLFGIISLFLLFWE